MIRPAALLAVVLCLPAPALAQASAQHHRDPGAIVFYEHANYQGRSVRIDGEAPNFQWLDFNDLASSIRIEGGGHWEVCIDAHYSGACQVIQEDRPDISRWAFNDRISSVRPVRFRGPGSDAGVTLYSEPDYQGRSLTLIDPVDNLTRMNFNDVARSIEVHSGVWTVCVDDDYEGGCRTLDRSVSDLRRLRLDGRITSLRPGPISQPPHRDPGHRPPPGGGYGRIEVEGGVPGTETVFFPSPRVRGYAVASCLYEDGYRCGQETARAVCEEAGLGRAIHFTTRYSRGEPLWLIGEDRPGQGREALSDLLCAR